MVRVKVWGTRGSFPDTSLQCSKFGGNTSCFSVDNGACRVVLDAGTGLVRMGNELPAEELHKPIHIFLSHVHLDHIQGLFFFSPLFDHETQLHIYGESRNGRTAREQIGAVFCPPYWPIRLEQCGAEVRWHEIAPGQICRPAADVAVKAVRARHPDQGDLYVVAMSGRVVVYGLDTELDDEILEGVRSGVADIGGGRCDLLISDACYTPEEYRMYAGRGHGSWEDGIRLAEACQAGRLWCSHHSYGRSDLKLESMEQEAGARREGTIFAREGEEISL